MPKVLDKMPEVKSQPVVVTPVAVAGEEPESKKNGAKKTGEVGRFGRAVEYGDIKVNGVKIPRENLRISVAMARDMLGWETEAEYKARMCKKHNTQDHVRFVFRAPSTDLGDAKNAYLSTAPECTLVLPDGQKVMCWRNVGNRPLDAEWMDALSQDILTRKFFMNCETIIVSKTKLVTSGQHRLLALIWAYLAWSGTNGAYWKTFWPDEPYIESLVAVGAEETPEVLMTMDNTKARKESDNFVVAGLIDWNRPNGSPLTGPEKKECGKYLESAVGFLWQRTGAEGRGGSFERHRTKLTAMDFVNKHQTLLKCVRHVWEENSQDGRAISGLGLSPGMCAAACYLMGSSKSDGDQYRHHVTTAERTEEGLDWSMLDKAKEFFSILAASDPDVDSNNLTFVRAMAPVRKALDLLVVPDEGASSGRPAERAAILAKAWAVYAQAYEISENDLALRYDEERDNAGNLKKRWLDECPLFGGIDAGVEVKQKTTAPAPKKADLEATARAERSKKDEELAKRFEESRARVAATADPDKAKRQLAEIEAMCPGKIPIIRLPVGSHAVFGTNALLISQLIGVDVQDNTDPVKLLISKADSPELLAKIAAKRDDCVIVVRKTVPVGHPAAYDIEPLVAAAPVLTEAVPMPVQGPLSGQTAV